MSISKLCDAVLSQTDIEGITISGGEPFLQPEALYALLSKIKTQSSLGVIIYTGYTVEQLQAMGNLWIEHILKGLADIIIDGEYVEELNDGMSLKGSSNQRVIFLTDRYTKYKALYEHHTRNVEVHMSDNELFFIGIPAKETWNQWRDAIVDVDGDSTR